MKNEQTEFSKQFMRMYCCILHMRGRLMGVLFISNINSIRKLSSGMVYGQILCATG